MILAVAVGVLQQPQNVGWIIVVTYAISLVQSQIISPLLVAGSHQDSANLVLLGQIIAAVFFGFLGILLASPSDRDSDCFDRGSLHQGYSW